MMNASTRFHQHVQSVLTRASSLFGLVAILMIASSQSTFGQDTIQVLMSRGIRWACHAQLLDVSPATPTHIPKAVTEANRPFAVPEMTAPSIEDKQFSFTDVGAKIPNYTPGARWGTQGAPLTLMQDLRRILYDATRRHPHWDVPCSPQR